MSPSILLCYLLCILFGFHVHSFQINSGTHIVVDTLKSEMSVGNIINQHVVISDSISFETLLRESFYFENGFSLVMSHKTSGEQRFNLNINAVDYLVQNLYFHIENINVIINVQEDNEIFQHIGTSTEQSGSIDFHGQICAALTHDPTTMEVSICKQEKVKMVSRELIMCNIDETQSVNITMDIDCIGDFTVSSSSRIFINSTISAENINIFGEDVQLVAANLQASHTTNILASKNYIRIEDTIIQSPTLIINSGDETGNQITALGSEFTSLDGFFFLDGDNATFFDCNITQWDQLIVIADDMDLEWSAGPTDLFFDVKIVNITTGTLRFDGVQDMIVDEIAVSSNLLYIGRSVLIASQQITLSAHVTTLFFAEFYCPEVQIESTDMVNIFMSHMEGETLSIECQSVINTAVSLIQSSFDIFSEITLVGYSGSADGVNIVGQMTISSSNVYLEGGSSTADGVVFQTGSNTFQGNVTIIGTSLSTGTGIIMGNAFTLEANSMLLLNGSGCVGVLLPDFADIDINGDSMLLFHGLSEARDCDNLALTYCGVLLAEIHVDMFANSSFYIIGDTIQDGGMSLGVYLDDVIIDGAGGFLSIIGVEAAQQPCLLCSGVGIQSMEANVQHLEIRGSSTNGAGIRGTLLKATVCTGLLSGNGTVIMDDTLILHVNETETSCAFHMESHISASSLDITGSNSIYIHNGASADSLSIGDSIVCGSFLTGSISLAGEGLFANCSEISETNHFYVEMTSSNEISIPNDYQLDGRHSIILNGSSVTIGGGSIGSDTECSSGDYVYEWISLAFLIAAIIVIILSVILIELRYRYKQMKLHRTLSFLSRQKAPTLSSNETNNLVR